MNNQALSFLGLAQKAGEIVAGFHAVLAAAEKGRVKLVIMAGDISGNTAEKVERFCLRGEIPFYYVADRDRVGKAIGRNSRAVLGITSRELASALERVLSSIDR